MMPLWRPPSPQPGPLGPRLHSTPPGGPPRSPPPSLSPALGAGSQVCSFLSDLTPPLVLFSSLNILSVAKSDFIATFQALREANPALICENIPLNVAVFQLRKLPCLTVNHNLVTILIIFDSCQPAGLLECVLRTSP